MIHDSRRFRVADVADADELARMLSDGRTWCLCNGFRFGGALFLNDAFSEDGAQEYAVVREADWMQVESVTFSWMTPAKAAAWLRIGLPAALDDPPTLVPLAQHRATILSHPSGSCQHCA